METLSSLHPVAQVFAIIGITVVLSVAIWQWLKTLRES